MSGSQDSAGAASSADTAVALVSDLGERDDFFFSLLEVRDGFPFAADVLRCRFVVRDVDGISQSESPAGAAASMTLFDLRERRDVCVVSSVEIGASQSSEPVAVGPATDSELGAFEAIGGGPPQTCKS